MLLDELNVLKFGRTYLLSALDACDDATLDFRPAVTGPSSEGPGNALPPYSIREHFLHIADTSDMFVYEGVLGELMPREAWRLQLQADRSWSLREAWPDCASIRRELQASWDFQDKHVFARPLEDLTTRVSPDSKYPLADEVGWLIAHESQHRGQILLLLRLAGIQPPAWD